ncbi:RNA-directed DNA polymerase from mobile element jockey [Trichonephila clavipes]|nr:RNA-directed DNA polymerase from mobile element jockey [Trichonephila clavipes]
MKESDDGFNELPPSSFKLKSGSFGVLRHLTSHKASYLNRGKHTVGFGGEISGPTHSRLTFKKHYLADKFWGRIHLAISLVGRRSPLSLDNKVILYKQILRPVITYGSPVWRAAATTHMKKIQVIQNKILRVMTNAPWYVRNDVIHNDLHMEPITNYITKLSRNVFKSIESHDNPIIKAQTLFTYPHPKIKYAYSSTKWRNPLRRP